DEVALRDIALELGQPFPDGLTLYTFSDDRALQVVPQVDRRAHDDRRIVAGEHAADEGLVDLDRVDRQLLQIAQARVADAEVVDLKLYAQALREGQCIQGARRILHQRALGDLELDGVRRRAPCRKQSLDVIEQPRVAHIVRRQVHRQRAVHPDL